MMISTQEIGVIMILVISSILAFMMLCVTLIVVILPLTKRYFAGIQKAINLHPDRYSIENISSLKRRNWFQRFCKRAVDLSFSLIAVTVFSTIIFVIILMLWIQRKGPVFYKKKIVGYKGKETYKIYFRPTTSKSSEFYRMLENLGLDCIPLYFKVLDGSLTLVGLSPHYFEEDEEYQKLCNYEKPGIVYLSSIFKCTTLEERVKFDIYYLQHQSLFMDLSIIIGGLLVSRTGYVPENEVAPENIKGQVMSAEET